MKEEFVLLGNLGDELQKRQFWLPSGVCPEVLQETQTFHRRPTSTAEGSSSQRKEALQCRVAMPAY